MNHVDGWGTLITPYGTFSVLRQKSEVYEYDSIYIDSLGFGVPVTRNYTEYKWLAKGMKIPVLQVNDNFGGLVAKYIDSVAGDPVGIAFHNESDEIAIFPNPVSKQLFIQFSIENSSIVEVTLYNMQGIKVHSFQEKQLFPGKSQITLNLEELKLESGNYFIEARVGDKIYSKKIIYLKN